MEEATGADPSGTAGSGATGERVGGTAASGTDQVTRVCMFYMYTAHRLEDPIVGLFNMYC